MQRAFLALLALLACTGFSPPARAEEVQSYYRVNVTGITLLYIGFGYTAPDGSFVSLAGNQIVHARLTIDYRPAAGEDINNLFIDMQVPTDAASQFFSVEGSQFAETSPGLFHFDLTTNLFNGTVQPGPFELSTYSLVNGEQEFTTGQYLTGSGFYYTVDVVPEPSTYAVLVVGGVGLLGFGVGRHRALTA